MTLLPQEVIRRKREGNTLDAEEIAAFIKGLTKGSVTEGQAAALAMAVFFRGMTREETVALTLAMRDSGTVLDWRSLGVDGPTVDKHSTGGVGDKVSLILAPLLAACGAFVPMISGRGLGHTGGTLDKMDSIPGYRSQPTREDFAHAVRSTGSAIVGATEDLAPADRRLYAIRDVTATVESLPLITASTLSKKRAEGTGALVLDVKVGNGAFMTTQSDATALAKSLVEVANGAGVPTVALLTDMDQPLGKTAGNALEVRECIDVLTGAQCEPRLLGVTLELATEALVLCGIANDIAVAHALATRALESGDAAERFAKSVAALGGPSDLLEHPNRHLAGAPHAAPLRAPRSGHIEQFDTRSFGVAIVELGGGRARASDMIDHAVGLSNIQPRGANVRAGEVVAVIHARTAAAAEEAAARLAQAITISDGAPSRPALILDRVTVP